MESLIDELAHAAGKDPVEYRRAPAEEPSAPPGRAEPGGREGRLGRRRWPKGRARGIAVHESFGSYVAQVAEVSRRDTARSRVHRVVCAVDCGIAVNPETIAAQMESGIAFGLGAALHSKLTFKDGRVQQSNFHDYQVLRLNEMPAVEVHIVPSTEKSGGVGEPGTAADRAGGGQRGVRPDRPAPARAAACSSPRRRRLRRPRPEETTMRIAVRHACFAAARSPPAARARQPGAESQGRRRLRHGREGLPASALQQLPHPRRPAAAVRCADAARRWAWCAARRARARRDCPAPPATREANPPASYGPHAPPGAPHWALPPPDHKMAWIGLPAAQLCAMIKDKKQQRRPRLRRAAQARRRGQAGAVGLGPGQRARAGAGAARPVRRRVQAVGGCGRALPRRQLHQRRSELARPRVSPRPCAGSTRLGNDPVAPRTPHAIDGEDQPARPR